MLPNSARVCSSDKKEIGKVADIRDDYFITRKEGLVMDEEYRIPIHAVVSVMPDARSLIIEIDLSEEQLKHGYEIVEGKPNSDLVKGKVDEKLKLPVKKQLIRYSALEYFRNTPPSRTSSSFSSGYECDICTVKFDNPRNLDKHKEKIHKKAVGV